jgi:hypothetical protein
MRFFLIANIRSLAVFGGLEIAWLMVEQIGSRRGIRLPEREGKRKLLPRLANYRQNWLCPLNWSPLVAIVSLSIADTLKP